MIVGVNRFAEADEEEIELHASTQRPSGARSSGRSACGASGTRPAADAALRGVREAARGDDNLLPPMREALAAMCTVGEICNALREEFGTYDAHLAP